MKTAPVHRLRYKDITYIHIPYFNRYVEVEDMSLVADYPLINISDDRILGYVELKSGNIIYIIGTLNDLYLCSTTNQYFVLDYIIILYKDSPDIKKAEVNYTDINIDFIDEL